MGGAKHRQGPSRPGSPNTHRCPGLGVPVSLARPRELRWQAPCHAVGTWPRLRLAPRPPGSESLHPLPKVWGFTGAPGRQSGTPQHSLGIATPAARTAVERGSCLLQLGWEPKG